MSISRIREPTSAAGAAAAAASCAGGGRRRPGKRGDGMARVSSLRDGERWEQVGVAVATKGATGAAVGLGLAVLLFGKMKTRSACTSICTGAGVGHGVTLGKSSFEDARAHLPTQLSQGWSDQPRDHSSQRRLFVPRATLSPIAHSFISHAPTALRPRSNNH